MPVISNTRWGVGFGHSTAIPSRARVWRRLALRSSEIPVESMKPQFDRSISSPPGCSSAARRSISENTEAADRSSSPVTAITL